jgi:predicted small metal-binding protein
MIFKRPPSIVMLGASLLGFLRGAPVIGSRDVGVDCDFESQGETVEDVLNQCGEHAKTAHGMSEISAELLEKVKSAIHDERAATASV